MRISLEVAPSTPRDNVADNLAQVNGLIGPPEYLLDQLWAYSSLGVTDVSLMPGRDDATSLHTIEKLGEQILPALRQK